MDGGRWEVVTKSGDHEKVRHYDAVAVCCGTHQMAKEMEIEGMATFKGTLEHSSTFWNGKKYAGKKVVVVGMGESSADIVRDISDVSSSCTLLVRSYPMCLPRVLPDGYPADSMTSRLLYPQRDDSFFVWFFAAIIAICFWFPLAMFGLLKKTLRWPYPTDAFGQEKEKFMDVRTERSPELVALMSKWHSTGDCSFLNKFATKNISWIPNVLKGKIDVKLGKIRKVDENSVLLDDGSTLDDIDTIVFCTGYQDEFPFLAPGLAPQNNDVRSLFLHAFNPKVGSSLVFIGFARPTTGAIPICSELIARYFALLVTGVRVLPDNVEARAVANAKYENELIHQSLAVRTCVNPCDFMDEVAKLIGCWPSPWRYVHRPFKFLTFLSALNAGARYRLVGPHAAPDVAEPFLDSIPITVPPPGVAWERRQETLWSIFARWAWRQRTYWEK